MLMISKNVQEFENMFAAWKREKKEKEKRKLKKKQKRKPEEKTIEKDVP